MGKVQEVTTYSQSSGRYHCVLSCLYPNINIYIYKYIYIYMKNICIHTYIQLYINQQSFARYRDIYPQLLLFEIPTMMTNSDSSPFCWSIPPMSPCILCCYQIPCFPIFLLLKSHVPPSQPMVPHFSDGSPPFPKNNVSQRFGSWNPRSWFLDMSIIR